MQKLEMLGHISAQNPLDHNSPQRLVVFSVEFSENIEFFLGDDLEGCGTMMILEHTVVVVANGQLGDSVDFEAVGIPSVVDVVHEPGEHDRQLAQSGVVHASGRELHEPV